MQSGAAFVPEDPERIPPEALAKLTAFFTGKPWVDVDAAAHALGVALGALPSDATFLQLKWVFWTDNALNRLLTELLLSLAQETPSRRRLLETRSTPDFQFRLADEGPNLVGRSLLLGAPQRGGERRCVVAIDFGETHFGFAYALTVPPQRVRLPAIKTRSGVELDKQPSCLLFDDQMRVVAHGIRAREWYLQQLGAHQILSLFVEASPTSAPAGVAQPTTPRLPPTTPKHHKNHSNLSPASFSLLGSNAPPTPTTINPMRDYLFFDGNVKMRMLTSGAAAASSVAPNNNNNNQDTLPLHERTCTTLGGDRSVPLLTVVSKMLEHVANDALEQINADPSALPAAWNRRVDKADVLWVVTVPSIWGEDAKAFMRRAAAEAGIVPDAASNDLVLALEPDCVAVAVHANAPQRCSLNPGDKLLVFDCGGGTTDVCAIQVVTRDTATHRFRFAQLLPPKGIPKGGRDIDAKFVEFLEALFGRDTLDRTRRLNPAVFVDVMDQWNELKCAMAAEDFLPGAHRKKTLDTSVLSREVAGDPGLARLCKAFNSLGGASGAGKPLPPDMHVHAKSSGGADILELPAKLVASFFQPTIDAILDYAHLVMRTFPRELPPDVQILLAGGLSNCVWLRSRFETEFPSARVMHARARSAALVEFGAVLFGLQPGVINARKARITLGLKATVPYNSKTHVGQIFRENKVYDRALKRHFIRNTFCPFVLAGQTVMAGEVVRKHFSPQPGADSIKFDVYTTDEAPPTTMVTEEPCRRLATIVVPVKPTPPGEKQPVLEVAFELGDAEIVCRVKSDAEAGTGTRTEVGAGESGEVAHRVLLQFDAGVAAAEAAAAAAAAAVGSPQSSASTSVTVTSPDFLDASLVSHERDHEPVVE